MKRQNLPSLIMIVTAVLMAACGGQASSEAPAEETTTISVSGALALFPLMTLWAEAYSAENPDIRFDVQGGGAGKGMTDVLSGAVDIAMLSRDARPEELEQGAYVVPVTIDAVVAIINAENPVAADLLAQGITTEEGAALWLSESAPTWGELTGTDSAEAINVYTRSDSSGAAEVWAQFLGGEAQEDLFGTGLNGDPAVVEAVRRDALGLGYVNVAFAFDPASGEPFEGLAVLPIDLDGSGSIEAAEDFYGTRGALDEAISAGLYPSPPARALSLVTVGEPSPQIAEFYRWVLTEGQQYVEQSGYVSLSADQIEASLELVPEE